LRYSYSALALGPQLFQAEALGEEEEVVVVVMAVDEEQDKAEEK
jgi:hypothetical protein